MTCISPGLGQPDVFGLQALANSNILPPKQQPTTMLELAVELGNSHLVQLLLDEGATVNPEGSVVPPLMIAVLHRHRGNVQLLLDARADPWKAIPIVSLCDHPWYWFGFLSRHKSVNVVQISVAQGPEDTVADLLPQSQDTQSRKKAEGSSQSSLDGTAMTEHATLLLGSIVQKYRSTGPQHMRGCYTSHRWRRILAGLYLPVRIGQELHRPAGLTRPETWLDQGDQCHLKVVLVARISKGVITSRCDRRRIGLCSTSTLPAIPCLCSRSGFSVSLRAVYRPCLFLPSCLYFSVVFFLLQCDRWVSGFSGRDWPRTVSASRPIFLVSLCPLPFPLFVVCFRLYLLGVPPFDLALGSLCSVLVYLGTAVGGTSPSLVSLAPVLLPLLCVVYPIGCLFPPPSPSPLWLSAFLGRSAWSF